MPSKRTNDSVDAILEDLDREQAVADVRDGANDQQVNAILQSLGIDDLTASSETMRLGPISEVEMPAVEVEPTEGPLPQPSFEVADTRDQEGPAPSRPAARRQQPAAPAQPRQQAPVRQQPAAPAQPRQQAPVRQQPAAPAQPRQQASVRQQPAAPAQPVHDPDFSGQDLTQSGEIKNFLQQAMSTDEGDPSATTILRRKDQFKKFFEKSIAVVPDEKGRLRNTESEHRHRGLFGQKNVSGDTTDEFVPINVSLKPSAGGMQQPTEESQQPEQPEELPMQESYSEAPSAPRREKRRGWSLFGGRKRENAPEEDVLIPEAREEFAEPSQAAPAIRWESGRKEQPTTQPAQRRQTLREEPLEEANPSLAQTNSGYASKYAGTRKVHGDTPEDTVTLGALYAAAREKQQTEEPSHGETGVLTLGTPPAQAESTQSFLYEEGVLPTPHATSKKKKKRDTLEFLPGQQPTSSAAAAIPQTQIPSGPVGEPVMPSGRKPRAAEPTQPQRELRPARATQPEEVVQTVASADVAVPAQPADLDQTVLSGGTSFAAPDPALDETRELSFEDFDDEGTADVKPAEPQATLQQTRQAEPQPPQDAVSQTTNIHFAEDPSTEMPPVQPDEAALPLEPEPDEQYGENPPMQEEERQPLPSEQVEARDGMPTAGFDAQQGEQPVEDADEAMPEEEVPGAAQPSTGFTAQLAPVEQQEAVPPTQEFVSSIEKSINTGLLDDDSTARTRNFDEAAKVLTEDLTDAGKHQRGARLGGTPEDEEEPEAGHVHAPFALPHAAGQPAYDKAEDAPVVHAALDKKVLYTTVASIVTGVVALLLLYLGTAAVGTVLPMPGSLDPLTAPAALLGVFLILLVLAGGLCWQTMLDGLRGLVGSPTPDTMPALAALGALVQLLWLLIDLNTFTTSRLCLFAGPAVLLLCFNQIGKAIDARTVRANFEIVSAGVDHAAAYRLREASVVHAITSGLGEAKPCVLVSRPTVLLKGFLSDSYSHRTSDKNQQQFAWAVGVCALLSLLFNLAWNHNAGKAVSDMAGVLCLAAPLAGTLLSAVPAQLMQHSAARIGAVVPGWKDIRQLGRANVIQISSTDLFPSGCVRLHGIKMVHQERIDTAIVYAASLLVESSSTLRNVFLSMIGDNRRLLHQVDDSKVLPGLGCLGWIDGTRVLAGNRELMEQYGIRVLPLERERSITTSQRKAIYLAESGNLMGIFLVDYARDPDTAAVLESLNRRGISLVLNSDDFNCDVDLIETVYSLPSGSVKVLTAKESEVLAPATAWLPESEGCMVHLGSFASFVGGMEAAAGAAEGEHKASYPLTASVIFGCVASLIITVAGGLVQLPLPALVLYQAAWCVLTLLFPLLQKY